MPQLEDIVLAWWRDQWDAAPTDVIIAARTRHGSPSLDESEVALMRAAEELSKIQDRK